MHTELWLKSIPYLRLNGKLQHLITPGQRAVSRDQLAEREKEAGIH